MHGCPAAAWGAAGGDLPQPGGIPAAVEDGHGLHCTQEHMTSGWRLQLSNTQNQHLAESSFQQLDVVCVLAPGSMLRMAKHG